MLLPTKKAPKGAFKAKNHKGKLLPLTGLHTRVLFIENINTTLATHYPTVFITNFSCFQRVTNAHSKKTLKLYLNGFHKREAGTYR